MVFRDTADAARAYQNYGYQCAEYLVEANLVDRDMGAKKGDELMKDFLNYFWVPSGELFDGRECPVWLNYFATKCPEFKVTGCQDPTAAEGAAICAEWSKDNYDNDCFRSTVADGIFKEFADTCGGLKTKEEFTGEHCPTWRGYATTKCPEWLGGEGCEEPTEDDYAAMCAEWSKDNNDNNCYRSTVASWTSQDWAEFCRGIESIQMLKRRNLLMVCTAIFGEYAAAVERESGS